MPDAKINFYKKQTKWEKKWRYNKRTQNNFVSGQENMKKRQLHKDILFPNRSRFVLNYAMYNLGTQYNNFMLCESFLYLRSN